MSGLHWLPIITLAGGAVANAIEFPLPAWAFWSLVILFGILGGLLRLLEDVEDERKILSCGSLTKHSLAGFFAGTVTVFLSLGVGASKIGWLSLGFAAIAGLFSEQAFEKFRELIRRKPHDSSD